MAYDINSLLNPMRPQEKTRVLFYGTPAHQAMLRSLIEEGYGFKIAENAASAKREVEFNATGYGMLIVSWSASPKNEGDEIVRKASGRFAGKIVVITSDLKGWKASPVMRDGNIAPVFIAVDKSYGAVTRETRQRELDTLIGFVRAHMKPAQAVWNDKPFPA